MERMNYEASGVSIDTANDTKKQFHRMVSSEKTSLCTPLNQVGAFASLVDIDLSRYTSPVFVLKSEEPGSKQLLSIQNGKAGWIAHDLINHLVNDLIVMGADPCAVLDTIICGKFQKHIVLELVSSISGACKENDCILVGGETSEQPGILPVGTYVLQASALGIVEKSKIIDGTAIVQGDRILAVASNGLHTNGYSLVRKLMDTFPAVLNETVSGEAFLDAVLKPHKAYLPAVRKLREDLSFALHGMAHITGGGIRDNLARIIPDGLEGLIDLAKIRIQDLFTLLRSYAGASDDDMLCALNMGVGMLFVLSPESVESAALRLSQIGYEAYEIGLVRPSETETRVSFQNSLIWGE